MKWEAQNPNEHLDLDCDCSWHSADCLSVYRNTHTLSPAMPTMMYPLKLALSSADFWPFEKIDEAN